MTYLENLSKKRQSELIKIYELSISEIKEKLQEAKKKGNDTTFLKKTKQSIEQELEELKNRSQQWAQLKIKSVYTQAIKNQDEIIKKALGELPEPKTSFNKVHREALQTLAYNTYNPIEKVSKIIGRNSLEYLDRVNFIYNEIVPTKTLRKAGIEGVKGAVAGFDTYKEAQKKIEKTLSIDNIFKVPYYNKKGDVVKLVDAKVYSSMVARTATAEAHRAGTLNRIKEYDYDLVDVIGNSVFPNSPCIPFENKTLSLSGKTEGFISLAQAKAEGLFHPNCIHDIGFSENNFDEDNQNQEERQSKEDKEELEFKRSYNYLAKNSGKFKESLKEYRKLGRDIVISKEKDAIIYHYTTNRVFRRLNESLRGERKLTPELEHYSKALDHSLKQLPDYKGNVYRYQTSLDNTDQFKLGNTVDFKQFLSTSDDLKKIEYFEVDILTQLKQDDSYYVQTED